MKESFYKQLVVFEIALMVMKYLDKYHYVCVNCGNEWLSNKKMKILQKKKKYLGHEPVNFELKENIIKKKDGTIKSIKLEVVGIRENKEELVGKYYRYNLKIDKCPKCIIDKKEADIFKKKNKLKEIAAEINSLKNMA